MPSYPLTFPTTVNPAQVKVRHKFANARFDNPITLHNYVVRRSGTRWEIDVELQPMAADLAAAWDVFFNDLQGSYGTFTLDLDPYCPGSTPGSTTFRLAINDTGWSVRDAVEFGFAFSAIENL